MSKRTRAIILLTLTTIIWGLAFLFQKNGGDIIGAFSYNGARYLLAIIILIPFIKVFDKNNEKEIIKKSYTKGMICGIFLFLAVASQQLGIQLTNYTGKAGFLTDMYILIVPLINVIYGKKLDKNTYIGIALCTIGFYYLCIKQSSSLNVGDIWLVVCAFFFALQILYIDKVADSVTTIRFAIGQYFTTALLGIIFGLILEKPTIASLLDALLSILYGGACSVAIAYTVQIFAQRDLDSVSASLIMSLESLFCVLFTSLFYHELMPLSSYFGALLIFSGIIISQLKFKKK